MPDGSETNSRSEMRVRQPPVDLLGHVVVEAPQAGLDVGHQRPALPLALAPVENGCAQLSNLAAASAQAIVEFTSPTTSTA